MKKSFQKSLIAASVGAVMFAAAGTASANSLLFPYFTTAAGAQSVLSIAGNSNIPVTTFTTDNLHYVYNYGTACTHFDGNGRISKNDLLQHSIASPAIGGFKAVGSDASTPFYFPLNTAGSNTGFLVVTYSGATPTSADISGDMAIVDPATGLVVSYAGLSNNSTREGDFSGPAFQDTRFNLSAYSASIVDTSWYAVVLGDMNAAISVNRNWTAEATLSNGNVIYDNDERPFSGQMTKKITCSGTILPTDLLTAAQAAAVGSNGGLLHATTTFAVPPVPPAPANPNFDQGTGLLMSKIQFVKAVPATGAFGGKMFLHRENGAAF